MILSYVTLGIVISLTALLGINSIDDELSATPMVYEEALYDLHSVEIISDRDVQALYVYLLTVVKSELSEYRENVETLPSKFKTSYSSALLSTPQEEPQRIKFEAIKRSWTAFTSVTDAVIDEFHETGLISTAELLSIEKSLHKYHQQVNAVIEYEHRKSEEALLSLNQIIENSRLL